MISYSLVSHPLWVTWKNKGMETSEKGLLTESYGDSSHHLHGYPSEGQLNMQTDDVKALNTQTHVNPVQDSSHFSALYLNAFLGNPQIHLPMLHEFSPNASSLSNDSTFDAEKGCQLSVIDEKRHKRLQSNRDSARRSRQRRKKQLEELQSQVNHLFAVNHQLTEKLIYLLDCNNKMLQENAQLKQQASFLQKVIADRKYTSTFSWNFTWRIQYYVHGMASQLRQPWSFSFIIYYFSVYLNTCFRVNGLVCTWLK